LGLAATPGLTPAAQEAYDRLLEQRRRGEPDAPFSLADAEAASRAVIQDARGALAEGRRVFLCRIPAMYDQPIAVGTTGLRGRARLSSHSRTSAGG
jgi:hypothetical protein